MTISNNYTPIFQQGNGITTQFSSNWDLLSASYLEVFFQGVATGIQTQQFSGFSVTFDNSGLTVTFVTPPPNTVYVVIGRAVTPDQTNPYKTSKGFQGATLEDSLDKLTALCQDLQDISTRTLNFPLGSPFVGILPTPVTGQLLMWGDGTGKVINGGNANDIANAQANAAAAAASAASAAASANLLKTLPQGRLTFASGLPIMNADVLTVTSVFYTPYRGNALCIYNGTNFDTITFTEKSFSLTNSAHLSGKLYDVFGINVGGILNIGTGPAWTNSTTRSAAITLLSGIYVNTSIIDITNGGLVFSNYPANKATYLGTIYCTANGQTQFNIKPAAASGGSNNIIGVWNTYNRTPIRSLCRDNNSPWTYGTNAWHSMDASTSNRISMVDGLGHSLSKASVKVVAGTATSQARLDIGINQNATTGTPGAFGSAYSGSTNTLLNNYQETSSEESFAPLQGFNFYQAMENSPNAVTGTFAPVIGVHSLILDTEY